MKVSVITTVLDEGGTIEDFLKSILRQSKKPDELVVIDGGSVDRTFEILEKYAKRYRWIRVFQVKGATIGKGRNLAVKKSRNNIIAITDAGCVVDRKWLAKITKPFEQDADVVVGIYKAHQGSDFEYFQGLSVISKPEGIFMNPSRMSSRSFALRKNMFEKVGGYPNLRTGEDTEFVLKIMKTGAKFEFAKNAVVYWRMRKSWAKLIKQFYNYGKGDKLSGNVFKMKSNLIFVLGFWIYILFLLASFIFDIRIAITLFALIFAYGFLEGIRLSILSRKLGGIFYGFSIGLVKRISYIMGVTFGK